MNRRAISDQKETGTTRLQADEPMSYLELLDASEEQIEQEKDIKESGVAAQEKHNVTV